MQAPNVAEIESPSPSADKSNMWHELQGFVQRNGVKTVLSHVVEIYIGGLLRSLPGVEGLFLRAFFYRCMLARAGESLLIYPGVYLIFSSRISLGKRVAVNTGTYIDGRGGISIGNYVMIGPNCVLASCDHGHRRTDIPMYQQPIEYAPITIEDDVWLGANVFVKKGVCIGQGSIVAAGSVIVSDVPPYSVFGGVPGKVISSRKTSERIS